MRTQGRQSETLRNETRRLWARRHEAGREPSVWRERQQKKWEKGNAGYNQGRKLKGNDNTTYGKNPTLPESQVHT